MYGLVCNFGSSSLKFSLFKVEEETLLAEGSIDGSGTPTKLVMHLPDSVTIEKARELDRHADAILWVLEEMQCGPSAPLTSLDQIAVVAHRVVHGGPAYTQPVRITPDVIQTLEALCQLAPLHNPPSIAGIEAVQAALPKAVQIALFDTAFHSTLGETARTYPIPSSWTHEWGVRRFGFHGLNHSYCSKRVAELLGRTDLRLITAHLGNGVSMSAVHNGRCVDTTMGFTPLDGLMMGTRSGAVDPGILIHALQHGGLDAEQLNFQLNHNSGLLGVSGISSDLRELLMQSSDQPKARLAIDIFVHSLRKSIGAMSAVLGGVDAIAFTGGIGEHSNEIRRRVCEPLEFLGLRLDNSMNVGCRPDQDIATRDSRVRVLVVTAREDLEILRQARDAFGHHR